MAPRFVPTLLDRFTLSKIPHRSDLVPFLVVPDAPPCRVTSGRATRTGGQQTVERAHFRAPELQTLPFLPSSLMLSVNPAHKKETKVAHAQRNRMIPVLRHSDRSCASIEGRLSPCPTPNLILKSSIGEKPTTKRTNRSLGGWTATGHNKKPATERATARSTAAIPATQHGDAGAVTHKDANDRIRKNPKSLQLCTKARNANVPLSADSFQ